MATQTNNDKVRDFLTEPYKSSCASSEAKFYITAGVLRNALNIYVRGCHFESSLGSSLGGALYVIFSSAVP